MNMSQVDLKKTLDIVEAINEYIARKEKELPYNINVIDELHANENAHSRILCKLLQYKDSSEKYRILEDLIQYISQLEGKEEFANITKVKQEIEDRFGKVDENIIFYMYEEWFEKLAKKLDITSVRQSERMVEMEIPEKFSNCINSCFIL